MKKKALYLVPVIALLITACQTNKPKSSSSKIDDEPSSSLISSSSSSEVKPTSSSSEISSSSLEPSSSEVSSSNEPSSSSSKEPDQIVNIELFALNDTHGNVIDSSSGLGMSKTSTLLKTYPKNVNNAIYISQGDMWQGQAESGLTFGKIVNDWMNQMNFVSMTVGNHEFDWGTKYVKENSEAANFPYLGINVYSNDTYERVDYLEPSTIIEKNGAKIGIIGAIGDCYSSISSSMVEDIYFEVGSELNTLVINEALRLRNEEECDFIIYSVHEGREDSGYNPYNNQISSYVDLVLEGHTHLSYSYTDSKNIYHVQGSGYNGTIPYLNIDINLTKKTSSIKEVKQIRTSDYSSLAKDPETEALFAKYNDTIGHVNDVIGYNSTYKNSTYLKKVVASRYLYHGQQKWGGSYDIFLGGGYISCRSPGKLEEGNVTYADLYTLFPFNNDLVLCSIPGSYLKSQFVNTTNSNYFVSYSSYGNAYKDYIDNYETYYIVTDTYSSDYSPNHLTVIERYSTSGYYARDMLKDYIAQGGFA